MSVVTERIDVAIIGAGPYGLSAAAHLRNVGREPRVFGEPLQFWSTRTPIGMLLRSPYTGSDIGAYVRGPNGAIYFWDDAGVPPNIGRITTSGTIVEVPAPSGQRGFGIAAGPDGNLWVASLDFSVDRVTTNGVFTIFPTPQAAGAPMAITAGPDGNLWFTTFGGQQLCRITTAGVVTLKGNVSSPEMAQHAGQVAGQPEGVVRVHNRLMVVTSANTD